MKSFEDWYSLLISDTLWYELLRAYKPDTIKKAGEKVFAQLVADSTVEFRPMSENRKHVYNILDKLPKDKPPGKPWYIQESEKKEAEQVKEWVPVSEEERTKRLKEWQEVVMAAKMLNAAPRISYKELAEEGGVLPPKPAPHPSTSFNEAYAKEKHIAYVKANYDPRTREKLPGWVPEEEFVWISKKQFSKTI